MATAQDLCDRAIRLLGLTESGENPTDDERNDALTAMNALLDSWDNEKNLCYAIRDESGTVSGASATIGPSGDLTTDRPVEVISAYVTSNSVNYNLVELSAEEYAARPDVTTTSDIPSHYYYQPAMANGVIYFYPPLTGSLTLHVLTRTPATSYALSDTVSLPPGWERAIPSNLALEIAPEYPVQAPPEVARSAALSLASIKRKNSRPVKAHTELAALVGFRGNRNILSDGQ